MQRVAWNDALDICPGPVKRGSHLSAEPTLYDRAECEVQDFHGSAESIAARVSGISSTPRIDPNGKGLGRTAAKAFFKNRAKVSHMSSKGAATPLWESFEEEELATLPELLQAEMAAIQQVLQESHEKINNFHNETEHKLNELRAENKLLRAGSGAAFKVHRHKSGRISQQGSRRPSAAPSAVASVVPSNRSSVQSARGINGSASFRGSWSSLLKRSSEESTPVIEVSRKDSKDKADKTAGNSAMFTPVTPLPPPSRGLNGCAKMEVEDYEDGQPETFTLSTHSPQPSLSTDAEKAEPKDEEQDAGRTLGEDRFDECDEEDQFSEGESTSSDSSNGMFKLLPLWTKGDSNSGLLRQKSTMGNKEKNFARISMIRDLTFKFTDVLAEENQKTEFCAHVEKFVLHPSSIKRAVWDCMCIFLVAYDLVAIPLALFEPEETLESVILAWVCRLFWSFDMPLAFFTGFIKSDGSLEMRPPKIAKRYVTTWFALDFFLVAIDWMESSWSNGLGYARLGKSSRVFRVLRMVRLLRMLRMKEVIQVFMERMHSERLWIFSDILKIMVLVVGMAHIIACLWYGIGNTDSQENTWVKEHLKVYHDLGARYAMSLHWSLSQFTGGMDEMRPHTVGERVFAICIYIFTFTVAAVFVSSLTSSMTRLHFIASHQSKQFFQLRRYLYQNNISDELTLRIQRNAQHAVTESQLFMQESSVDLLAMVSEPLRIDLHFELYSPIYHLHPFFDRYSNDCPQVMRKVCHRATSMTLASCGDTMFDAGEIPAHPKMIFVCSGEMQYVSIGGTETQVKAVIWISEAVLWTPWMHLGVLTATSECRLIVLDSQKFHHIVAQYDHADMDPRKYAETFVDSLNATTEEITDLPLNNMTMTHNNSRIKNRRLTIQFTKNF